MKVILTEDHDTLGAKGDTVEVKNGYGQNFLLPRRLAVVATSSNVKRYAEERRQAAHKIEAARAQTEALAARVEGTEVVIAARTGEEGRLFGTVTTTQIAEALAEKGFAVDRRTVSLASEIRETGTFPATVRFGRDVSATVQVVVVPEAGAPSADDAEEA